MELRLPTGRVVTAAQGFCGQIRASEMAECAFHSSVMSFVNRELTSRLRLISPVLLTPDSSLCLFVLQSLVTLMQLPFLFFLICSSMDPCGDPTPNLFPSPFHGSYPHFVCLYYYILLLSTTTYFTYNCTFFSFLVYLLIFFLFYFFF